MVMEGGDSWHSVARVQIQRNSGFINSVAHEKNLFKLGIFGGWKGCSVLTLYQMLTERY